MDIPRKNTNHHSIPFASIVEVSLNNCTDFFTELGLAWKTVFIFCMSSCMFHFSQAQDISFSVQSSTGNFCAPSTLRFTPNFTSQPIAFFWEFGVPGEESDEQSPAFTYNVPGVYEVKLVALFEGTISESKRLITIFGNPALALAANKTYLCNPGEIQFLASSVSSFSWMIWNAGDGSAPVVRTNMGYNHTFRNYGDFSITATGVDENGCAGNASIQVSIKKPTAKLSYSMQSNCAPAKAVFSADVDVPAGSRVVSYTWNFDEFNEPVTTDTNSVSYVFSNANTYNPTVSILTNEGCNNVFSFSPVVLGKVLTPLQITASKDTICGAESIQFTATNSPEGIKFLWDINGQKHISQDSFWVHKFNQLGTFRVYVSPISGGCEGEPDSIDVTVSGVIANFRFQNLCTDRSFFNFTSTSHGHISSIVWDFGNGNTISGISRPSEKFDSVGTFHVTLSVYDNRTGCTDEARQTIYTARPILVPSDSFICRGQPVTLAIAENYANPRVVHNWLLGGRTLNGSPAQSFSNVPQNFGEFTNRVIIDNGTGYCRDTLIQTFPLWVRGPIAGIQVPSVLCVSEEKLFQDSSHPFYSTDTLTGWKWSFGNGIDFAGQKPPPVLYSATGTITVGLIVEDKNGCMDSTVRNLRIRRSPILKIFPTHSKVCAGADFDILAIHNSSLRWSAATPINCDTCNRITVSTLVPATYTAMVTDAFGCTNSAESYIDVWQDFTLPPNNVRDTGICLGEKVQFNLNTTGMTVVWSPADVLSAANIPNPIATPVITTTYRAIITDMGNCFSKQVSATVVVNQPPQVNMGPDLVVQYNTPFSISPVYGADVVAYRWRPSNLLDCDTCRNPTGIASVSTRFDLTAISDEGCTSEHSIKLILACSDNNWVMPNAFTPNNDGLNDRFYPMTRGVTLINNFIIYNRFGQVIFQRNNFVPNDSGLGWDGGYKGEKQPLGSYIYMIEGICDAGNVISTKGAVVIAK
jgi:gliding motility-associated-like protein